MHINEYEAILLMMALLVIITVCIAYAVSTWQMGKRRRDLEVMSQYTERYRAAQADSDVNVLRRPVPNDPPLHSPVSWVNFVDYSSSTSYTPSSDVDSSSCSVDVTGGGGDGGSCH